MGSAPINEISFFQGVKSSIKDIVKNVYDIIIEDDDINILYFKPLEYPKFYEAIAEVRYSFETLFRIEWTNERFILTEYYIDDTVEVNDENKDIFSEETIELYGVKYYHPNIKTEIVDETNFAVFTTDHGPENLIITDPEEFEKCLNDSTDKEEDETSDIPVDEEKMKRYEELKKFYRRMQ